MKNNYFSHIMNDVHVYKVTTESYKKRFLLKKRHLDHSQTTTIQQLFNKIDVLRNGLLLHAKQIAKKDIIRYNEKPVFIEKSQKKIKYYFQQLDAYFLSMESRY